MTKEETAKLLAYLCSAFPQVTIRKENAEAYHRFLQQMDFAEVMAAADVLILESKWFPTVAQIVETVGQQTGRIGPSSEDAWTEVALKASRFGLANKPSFSHPAIDKAVESIGWRNICLGNVDNVRFQFSRVYSKGEPNVLIPVRRELNGSDI